MRFSSLSPLRVLVIALVVLAMMAAGFESDSLVRVVMHISHVGLLGLGGLATWWVLRHFELAAPTALLLRWEHRLITALLLFLLFDPGNPWWVFLSLGVVTELVQRWLRVPTGPILNPAAAGGLLVGAMGYLPDWWGVSFEPRWLGMSLVTWLLLPAFIWVAVKYRKVAVTVLALLGFVVGQLILQQQLPLALLLDGTLLFFGVVMVVEPKTSPATMVEQRLFGLGIGVVLAVLLKLHFFEPYLGALVLTETAFQLWRYKQRWLVVSH